MLDCVEAGIPVEIVPVTLMGLIAPATLVGALVFHCVDVLAGLTMAQIIRPGAPVLFGGAPATFHMKAPSAPMAAIEAQRLNAAHVAIAKSLGLPTQAYMALSDSKFLDAQAGAESFSSALLAAIAGINSVSGPGRSRTATIDLTGRNPVPGNSMNAPMTRSNNGLALMRRSRPMQK
ncbi:MAG: hypothetical protein GY949_18865 [Gammaproteobacteria bacterium]|nr:hypothetical protein [Gammaproteobacteria bacterium]